MDFSSVRSLIDRVTFLTPSRGESSVRSASFATHMSDSVQAQQRNLYNEDVKAYRDGAGTPYMEQLRQLSWPIPTDVPTHAQFSSQQGISEGHYKTLPPMEFMHKDDYTNECFTKTYGSFGIRSDVRAAPSLARLACERTNQRKKKVERGYPFER